MLSTIVLSSSMLHTNKEIYADSTNDSMKSLKSEDLSNNDEMVQMLPEVSMDQTTASSLKLNNFFLELLANEMYKVVFDRNGEFPLAPVEANGPYAEQFVAGNQWFNTVAKEIKTIPFIDNDGFEKNLNAYYVAHTTKTDKTVIFAHGYRMNALEVGGWVKMYYDMGYNVLVPDARAHGLSEGTAISFGWKERSDYKNWVNTLISENSKVQIIISGVSMGGATTMMSSGEDMPENVKAYISDCGYTSMFDEFNHLKPTFKVLINQYLKDHALNIEVNDDDIEVIMDKLNTKLVARQGFALEKASSLEQLRKNKKPILFIHGKEDQFVPTDMIYQNYQATQGEKDLWVVPETGHGGAIVQDLPGYQQHIQDFLKDIID